jgi:hypothetical protein
MGWVHGALAVLSLAIGLMHLVRLVLRRRDLVLEGSYAAMALGMAGMFSPLGDPLPAGFWGVVFLLCAGWFGGLMIRARAVGLLGGEAAHLVIGSAAMLFMLGADRAAGGVGGQHAAHGAGAPGMVGVASAIALVFAAYFVLHTLRCADRLWATRPAVAPGRPRTAGGIAAPDAATAVALRTPAAGLCSPPGPALAHLLMTAAMAIMLVEMI